MFRKRGQGKFGFIETAPAYLDMQLTKRDIQQKLVLTLSSRDFRIGSHISPGILSRNGSIPRQTHPPTIPQSETSSTSALC